MPTDPLSQLRDIHLPSPIGVWPPALGWWILGILAIVLLLFLTYRIVKALVNNRYRRHGINELRSIFNEFEQHQNCSALALNINVLLKRICLHYYGNGKVERLSSEGWLAFLDSGAKTDGGFSDGAGQILASGPYGATSHVDSSGLKRLCELWIRRHK